MAGEPLDENAVTDPNVLPEMGTPEDVERLRRRVATRDRLVAGIPTMRDAGKEPATVVMTNAQAQARIRRLERAIAALVALLMTVPATDD